MDELDKAINDVIETMQGNVLSAVEAAGNVVLNEVKIRAKGSIRDNLSIKVFRVKDGARASIQVDESAKGGDKHHAVFIEYGTSKMPAQPFMRPGYDASKVMALETFIEKLAAGMGK
jgi:HK97 gp10 family phage protein